MYPGTITSLSNSVFLYVYPSGNIYCGHIYWAQLHIKFRTQHVHMNMLIDCVGFQEKILVS